MYSRVLNIDKILKDDSIFLLGARQTGKSTFLNNHFEGVETIDLLKNDIRKRLARNPELLRELLESREEGTLVIIDEIQKVPELLDEIHWLIVNKGLRFVLCGSSARKLKKYSSNRLGGRAIPVNFYPFVSCEVPDFDVMHAVQNGMIPRHYMASDAKRRLKAYVDLYVNEEVVGESLVRNLDSFERFLEVAAISDGEMLNYENVASDCGVSAVTVKEYFQILTDTLLGYQIPAYAKSIKRKLVQTPRFYIFDVGIVNYLTGRMSLKHGTDEFGHAFEHLIVQEIVAYLSYAEKEEKISYWRTYSGIEVDVILGDAKVAIEIKSADEVKSKHRKNLGEFAKEYEDARLILVSLDKLTRKSGNVECIYVYDFLKLLWEGKII